MIPDRIIAGDTLKTVITVPGYSPADGWSLVFRLANEFHHYDISGVDDGNGGFVVSASTAGWEPGEYRWNYAVEKSGERYTQKSGLIEIFPDLSAITPLSHVKRVLDALEAMILGKASRDQIAYSIAGRSLSRLSPTELLEWRDKYRREYARLKKEDALRNGIALSTHVYTRLIV